MISIIVAVAANNVIGGENKLLWHIKEDLQRFKTLTSGHAVVMGRKTWESLGRPLPKRTNIVITRNPDYKPEGALVAQSLEAAIELAKGDDEIFVIGGGEIYRQAMSIADRLYITHVECSYEGDTTFPDISAEQWRVVEETRFERGEKYEYPFRFTNYERNK
jgi:dihydrofolate reductase